MWRAHVQDLININPIKYPYLHQCRHYSKVMAPSSSKSFIKSLWDTPPRLHMSTITWLYCDFWAWLSCVMSFTYWNGVKSSNLHDLGCNMRFWNVVWLVFKCDKLYWWMLWNWNMYVLASVMAIGMLKLDWDNIIMQNQVLQNYASSMSENTLAEWIHIQRAYWLCIY